MDEADGVIQDRPEWRYLPTMRIRDPKTGRRLIINRVDFCGPAGERAPQFKDWVEEARTEPEPDRPPPQNFDVDLTVESALTKAIELLPSKHAVAEMVEQRTGQKLTTDRKSRAELNREALAALHRTYDAGS